jgi:Ni/Co efflux regulator RcnB
MFASTSPYLKELTMKKILIALLAVAGLLGAGVVSAEPMHHNHHHPMHHGHHDHHDHHGDHKHHRDN